MSPLWPQQCPQGIHKVDETSDGAPETARNSECDIPGRYLIDGRIETGVGTMDTGDLGPAQTSRIQDQLGEVTACSNPSDYLLGIHNRCNQDETDTTRGEGTTDNYRLSVCNQQRQSDSEGAIKVDWEDVSNHVGSSPSPTVLQRAPTTEKQSICHLPILRDHSNPDQRGNSGVEMVDKDAQGLEWTPNSPTNSRSHHRDRCITAGMGGSISTREYRWPLVRGGTGMPHQCPGANGWSLSNQDLCQRQAEHPYPPKDGQQNSHDIYQSDGGNKVSNSITGGMRPMALVPTERDNIISRAPTRGAEHHSRHGIQDTTITSRVDAGKVNLPQGNADPGTMLNRSLRNQTQQPAGKVHKLAPRPIRNCNRRLPVVLAGRDWVHISPICTDWQMSAEGAPRTVYSGSDHPHMEHTTLVPSVTGPSGRVPIIASNTKQTPNRPFQQSASSNSEQPTAVGRLESVRKTHIAEGISKQASELILSSWSKGTNTAYQSGWTKWASWCAERKVDPISSDVQHFIDFLAELYEQGLQHRSINTIRSAVSMTHKSVEGLPVGQHPLVTRLLKGVYNQRPPMPRYTSTWDVDVVTKHIVSMGRNEDLPLKHLSRKLVMLMALIKASRTSELRALDIRFRIYKPDGVIFKLTSLTKKRNPGLPLKELFFRAFPSDERLCIVHCLRQYEKITQELRSSELEEKPLFISYTRPHKPVTSQRLAHWIKDLLSEAGVDNIFKAHSVRGASTSAAMSRGVSLADILSTADWSKESTFRRFYYRESSPNGYVSKVLQGGTTTQAW